MTTTFRKDGTLVTGTEDITILETGEVYGAENFGWTQDAIADITATNGDGSPKGSQIKPGFTNGTGVLQLADDSQPLPKINETFQVDGEGYYISGRGKPQEQNGETKISINFRKCENPLITEPAANVALTQSVAMTQIDSAAVGPESGLTYAWSATGLPSGVSIDSGTGAITGTPDTVETAAAVIKCSATKADGNSVVGTRYITFTVTA